MRRHDHIARPRWGSVFFASLFAALLLSAGLAHAALVYDFEGLAPGQLVGQDNWENSAGGTAFTVAAGSGWNTTQVAEGTGTGTAVVRRANDPYWRFSAYTASQTAAEMQFDLKYVDGSGSHYFGLGGDSRNSGDGDDRDVDELNERAPGFGYMRSGGVPSFVIRDLADGVTNVFETPVSGIGGVDAGDWIRLKMTIDFTAFGGGGGGRLHYMNLTDGDPGFTELTTTAVDLRITDMWDDVEDPARWDTMVMVKTSGGSPQFDHLVPSKNTMSMVIREDFEGLSGSTLPTGWKLIDTTDDDDSVYENVARGSGVAGRVKSDEQFPSGHGESPGAYALCPTFLRTSLGFSGSFEIFLEEEGIADDGIFIFGDLNDGLTFQPDDALIVKLIDSEYSGTSHLVDGRGTGDGLLDESPLVDDETWHRVEFSWTPTDGTTGDFTADIYKVSDGSLLGTLSTTGFTFAPPWVQFGFGSVNDAARFDNIQIVAVPEPGTLLFAFAALALLATRRRRTR